MTAYRIIRNEAEKKVNWMDLSRTVYPGCTLDETDQYPEEVAKFTTRTDAMNALKRYTATVEFFHGVTPVARVTEFLIEEYEVDEDGDFLDGSDYDVCKWPETLTDGNDTFRWNDSRKTWDNVPEEDE